MPYSLALLCLLPAFTPTEDARPADTTPHLDRAEALIRKQVDWFGDSQDLFAREFLVSLATMNLVQSRVSPLNYALRAKEGQPFPTTPEAYLAMESGICGGQVMTFRALLDRLGIRNRPVEFYFRGATPAENHSHIGAEVFYNNDWHFFDITWGTYYRKGERRDAVLSIKDLLGEENPREWAITNRSDLWFQQWTSKGLDPFEYLSHGEMDLIVGRAGSVLLRAREEGKLPQVFAPSHQPGYVGRNDSSADFGSIVFRLSSIAPTVKQCRVTVVGVAGAGELVIRGGTTEVRRPLGQLPAGDHRFDLSRLRTDGELEVLVESPGERQIGYVVIRRITIE